VEFDVVAFDRVFDEQADQLFRRAAEVIEVR
jgi:hypothetical protein